MLKDTLAEAGVPENQWKLLLELPYRMVTALKEREDCDHDGDRASRKAHGVGKISVRGEMKESHTDVRANNKEGNRTKDAKNNGKSNSNDSNKRNDDRAHNVDIAVLGLRDQVIASRYNKPEALDHFIYKNNLKPKRVIFIDDNSDNVMNMLNHYIARVITDQERKKKEEETETKEGGRKIGRAKTDNYEKVDSRTTEVKSNPRSTTRVSPAKSTSFGIPTATICSIWCQPVDRDEHFNVHLRKLLCEIAKRNTG